MDLQNAGSVGQERNENQGGCSNRNEMEQRDFVDDDDVVAVADDLEPGWEQHD